MYFPPSYLALLYLALTLSCFAATFTALAYFPQGGQHCDETGNGRRTEVQFFCCDPQSDAIASIQSIEETELCTYKLIICSLLTCKDSMLPKAPTMKRLMASINGLCFQRCVLPHCPLPLASVRLLTPLCGYRQDGWWTYELCIGKYVRQFHMETMLVDDKTSKTVIDTQFVLGKARARARQPSSGAGIEGVDAPVAIPEGTVKVRKLADTKKDWRLSTMALAQPPHPHARPTCKPRFCMRMRTIRGAPTLSKCT